MIKCLECKNQPTTQIGKFEGYCHHTHYSVCSLDSFKDIKEIFPDGKADKLNWLIASTSGVHGTHTTLKEIEKTLCTAPKDRKDGEYYPTDLTVLIILPRMVRLIYGNIEINNLDELEFLRGLIFSSLKEIAKTQKENMFDADLYSILEQAFENSEKL